MKVLLKYCFAFALFCSSMGQFAFANSENEHHEEHAEEAFNAGDMIMHHILDAHELHLFADVSIPLPIILYSEEKGVEVFSSSHFGHGGSESYKGYVMHHEKIYVANADGHLDYDQEGHPTNAMPMDFSITKTVVGLLLTIAIMMLVFFSVAKAYKKRGNQAPKGLQSFIEPLIVFVRDDIAKPSIGKKFEKYLPFLLTVFFFIWISNLLGLIPFIGFNVTGNIAVTLVLALFVFVITTFSGNKNYWVHIVNTPGVPWWLKIPIPLMPIIELIGVISKPVVLTLRLFANITAGHIIILSFVSLIFIFGNMYGAGAGFGVSILSLVFSIFMYVIELLVAFLQAYVFTLLAALYFGAAVEEHHH